MRVVSSYLPFTLADNETAYRMINRHQKLIIGIVEESNDDVIIFNCGKVIKKNKVAYSKGVRIEKNIDIKKTCILGFKNDTYQSEEEIIKGYQLPKYKELSEEEKIIFNSIK